MLYINLHTHRKPLQENEVVIRNAFTQPATKLEKLNYYLSCGIHPWLIKKDKFNNLICLKEALELPNVLALGECGLDRAKGAPFPEQLSWFEKQLEIAVDLKKPVILHLVRAYSDIIPFKKKYNFKGIIHGFKGNINEAKMLLDHGLKLSFGYRLFLDKKIAEIFKEISSENIYLETDVKPISIASLYTQASIIRNEDPDQFQRRLKLNFERDFSVVLPR